MYCSKCGKQNMDQAIFCVYCGSKLLKLSKNVIQKEEGAEPRDEALNEKVAVPREEVVNEQVANEEVVEPRKEAANEEVAVPREEATSEEMAKKRSKKPIIISLIIAILLALGIGGTLFYINIQNEKREEERIQNEKTLQKENWEEWLASYQTEVETYYLSEEEKTQLTDYIEKAKELEEEEDREKYKRKLEDFKQQLIDENEQFVKQIDESVKALDETYDLTYAYEDELQQIEVLKQEINKLKEEKKYDEALNKLEECKEVEEAITKEKTGWQVTVLQKDITAFPTVKLYVDVKDRDGNVVENLDQKIFFLSQQDASSGEFMKKTITSAMQLNQNENININLVADVSGSMEGNIGSVKSIMNNFLNTVQFGVGDEIALTEFSDMSTLVQDFTTNKEMIMSQINSMGVYGGTKLYDTLIESVLRVNGQSGAKCVIAFTDGLDNRSASSVDDVIRVAQNCSIPIFIIGIGSEIDHNILEQIASSTGGYYRNISSVGSDMQDIYNSIYARQKEVYCVEYEADSDMTNKQSVRLYLRGEESGGSTGYTFQVAGDLFGILLNNYLNSYIEALTKGDTSIMAQAGYASLDGGVYKETKAFIDNNKTKLMEQLLSAEVTNVTCIDENTYEIDSRECYDIQQIKDYDKEIANDTSDELATVRSLLASSYSNEELKGQRVYIHKERVLKGSYIVRKNKEGQWQIADFKSNYENLGTTVYTAYLSDRY